MNAPWPPGPGPVAAAAPVMPLNFAGRLHRSSRHRYSDPRPPKYGPAAARQGRVQVDAGFAPAAALGVAASDRVGTMALASDSERARETRKRRE